MSSSRKNTVFRKSIGDTAVSGGGIIFTYINVPPDTSILAEAKLIAHDAVNSPALGSACFVSTAGARRLGNASPIVLIGTGNHALVAEVDAAIAGGSPGLAWVVSGNNLQLQFSTPTGATNMFYQCEILLHIN